MAVIGAIVVVVPEPEAARAMQLPAPPPAPAVVSSHGSPAGALTLLAAPSDVELPRTAAVLGTIDGWTTAAATEVAAVLPEVGSAAHGRVSVVIDAPATTSRVTVLAAGAAVKAGETYQLSGSLRLLSPTVAGVPAELVIGDKAFSLPALGAEWSEFRQTYTAVGSTATVALVVKGGVSGLGIDNLSLVGSDGHNLLPNPSFERVSAGKGIANETLTTTVGTATLAVAGIPGQATWSAKDSAGKQVATGSAMLSGAVDAVPLNGLGQGYFTIELKAGATTLAAPVGVLDIPGRKVPVDHRLGAVLQLATPHNQQAVPATTALGFGAARADVLWELNERKAGEITFSPTYRDQFARLSASGVEVLAMVGYGNPLYDGGRTPGSTTAVNAYANYARAVVQQLRPKAVEVYNEFNHPPFNNGSCGTKAKCYLPLLKAVHNSVAKVDPKVTIVAGATAYYQDKWFHDLWKLGGLKYADAMSFHPYDVRVLPERLVDRAKTAAKTMKKDTKKTIPAWVTEMGWTTRKGGVGVKAADQGSWLVRGEVSALAGGIKKFFWYDLIDDGTKPDNDLTNYGLYYHPASGEEALRPKPGAFAQALLSSKIAGLKYASSDKIGDKARSVVFGSGSKLLRVAWRIPKSKSTKVVYKASKTVKITDLQGKVRTVKPKKGKVTVKLTESPVFIEGTSKAKASRG